MNNIIDKQKIKFFNPGKEYNVMLFRSTLLTAGTAVVMLVSGCVSHKSPPAIIHADNYTAETLKTQQVVPPADRILGLKEAIRIGLTNNPTYKQMHLALVSAYATLYAQMAKFSPELAATYGATQTQSSDGAGALNSVSTDWTGNLAASWNVFKGLQTTMDTLSKRASALSAEEAERDYRRTLIYAITTAYNQILLDRANVQIALSDEQYNEQEVRDSQLKYNAGASSLADLLNFKIGKAKAQNSVITNTTSYKVDRYVLAALLGLTTADLPEETQFPPIQVSENEEYSLAVDFYLDLAIAQRPDLKAAKLDLDALRYTLYSKWGAFSPSVDLALNYGFSTTGTNSYRGRAVPNGDDLNYNYGFTASWDVWKGGSRIADVRGAQAALDSQEEELMSTWITVVQEVRTTYTNLLANIEHRKLLKKIMDMAQQRRDLVREEYNAGNIEIATLNQAQNNLVSAESEHIQSVINVANSRAQLDSVCGTNVVE